mmetsp:Transcript_38372/g.124252  ORF Transcript_38372/g.124252 Transcript_38372/m.124252 type:complete len:243 (-) Transcript_38372:536-1264(-)
MLPLLLLLTSLATATAHSPTHRGVLLPTLSRAVHLRTAPLLQSSLPAGSITARRPHGCALRGWRTTGTATTARCGTPHASLLSDAASDQWLLYTVLTTAAATGYRLGVSTKLGRRATGPICAMGLTFVAAGTGALPPASAPVSAAQGLAVRLATPLLLFGADLRAIASRARLLMPAFALGCLGTVLGTLAGWAALRGPLASAFGADALKVVAALAAKNIGGGLNFVAVAGAVLGLVWEGGLP